MKGHRETITCLHISDSGKWLTTGSEDTSVNLWEINVEAEVSCKLKHRMRLSTKLLTNFHNLENISNIYKINIFIVITSQEFFA